MQKHKNKNKIKNNDRSKLNRVRGFFTARFTGRQISKPVTANNTELPGLQSLNLIAQRNKRIAVISIGDNESITGFNAGSQLLEPTVQTQQPQGFRSPALRGVNGGPRIIKTYIMSDRYMAFSSELRSGSKPVLADITNASQDTIAYWRTYFDLLAIARKTPAQYMPIMQATFPDKVTINKQEQDNFIVIGSSNISSDTNEYWAQAHISVSSLEKFFKVSKSDLAASSLIMMGDYDTSKLAYELQLLIDVCFNNLTRYAQIFFRHRDTIRLLAARLRRNAIMSPIKNLATALKSDAAKICSGNFYNYSDYLISRVQRENTSARSPLHMTNFNYNGVKQLHYNLAGGPIQTITRYGSILPTYYSEYNVNGRLYRVTQDHDYNFEQFFDAIIQDNVEAAENFVLDAIDKLSEISSEFTSKYAFIRTLLSATGVEFKNTDLPLEINFEQPEVEYVEYNNHIPAISDLVYVQGLNGEAAFCSYPDVKMTNVDASIKITIDENGNYPSFLNTNMFMMNIPQIHNSDYLRLWPSGLVFIAIKMFNANNEEYTDIYTAQNTSFVNDYALFLKEMNKTSKIHNFAISNGSVSITLANRNQSVLMDDILQVSPQVDVVYDLGKQASPLNKYSIQKISVMQ